MQHYDLSMIGIQTHNCKLYEKVGLSSLYTRRMEHWYMFLYKAILHDLPPYLCSLMVPKTNSARITRSSSLIMYNVPRTRTTFGESAFKSFAPSSWCKLQEHLKLESLITLNNYKSRIKDYLTTNWTLTYCQLDWCFVTFYCVLCLVFSVKFCVFVVFNVKL